MESSQFSDVQPRFESMEPVRTNGGTCDTFCVKLYGKLHFLKRLKPEFVGNIRYQEAQRKEFETGYRLEHPHIVRYLSLSDDGILMEYVDGETLSHRLAEHPEYFTKQNTDKLLRQLLDALGYLHAHQVLHLDLKPDNILLTRINSDVKLVDFGCCYTDTFADTQGHTDGFAAPEQLAGGNVDERTDIYAVGKVIQCLPLSHIYNKVAARCTASSPSERYQSIAALADAVFRKRLNRLWPLLSVLAVALSLCCFFLIHYEQPSAETPQPVQQENNSRGQEVRGEEQEVRDEEPEVRDEEPEEARPAPSVPVKKELSEEEKAFLAQPHLHVASAEEFDRYKQKLDEYYSEANAFLNDTTNFQKYPSHHTYVTHYQEIIYRALERIKADEWFHPLYNSPMNPVSSYTRKYKADLEHRAFVNGNKLP